MTNGPSEWNIRAPAEQCCRCTTRFQDRQPIISRLWFGQTGYERHDFCLGCWNDAERSSAVSVWKTEYRMPPPPPPEPIQKQTAESLLRKLMESSDPKNWNAIFVLAVMLERKRILVERDVRFQEDGQKLRVYEHKKTGETFVIVDPQLRLSALEEVQREVVALLGGGGENEVNASQEPQNSEGNA